MANRMSAYAARCVPESSALGGNAIGARDIHKAGRIPSRVFMEWKTPTPGRFSAVKPGATTSNWFRRRLRGSFASAFWLSGNACNLTPVSRTNSSDNG